MKIASPTLKIKYVPLPSKFDVDGRLAELDVLNDPLLPELKLLLPPFPPTKLRARLPLLLRIRTAADRTPMLELKPEEVGAGGVDGEGLSFIYAIVT